MPPWLADWEWRKWNFSSSIPWETRLLFTPMSFDSCNLNYLQIRLNCIGKESFLSASEMSPFLWVLFMAALCRVVWIHPTWQHVLFGSSPHQAFTILSPEDIIYCALVDSEQLFILPSEDLWKRATYLQDVVLGYRSLVLLRFINSCTKALLPS